MKRTFFRFALLGILCNVERQFRLTLEDGTVRLSRNVHSKLRKIPKDSLSHLHHGGSLESGRFFFNFACRKKKIFGKLVRVWEECTVYEMIGTLERINIRKVEVKQFLHRPISGPEFSRRLMVPDFKTVCTLNVVMLLDRIHWPRLRPTKYFCLRLSRTQGEKWPEGLCQWKFPMKPSNPRHSE